jgi:hypothetical protein
LGEETAKINYEAVIEAGVFTVILRLDWRHKRDDQNQAKRQTNGFAHDFNSLGFSSVTASPVQVGKLSVTVVKSAHMYVDRDQNKVLAYPLSLDLPLLGIIRHARANSKRIILSISERGFSTEWAERQRPIRYDASTSPIWIVLFDL